MKILRDFLFILQLYLTFQCILVVPWNRQFIDAFLLHLTLQYFSVGPWNRQFFNAFLLYLTLQYFTVEAHLYFIWRSIFFSWRIYTLFDASIFFSCAMEFDDLLTLLRQSGTSIEIPTDDDYECTVLFLWNRKKTNSTSTSTSVATNTKNNKAMTDVAGKN